MIDYERALHSFKKYVSHYNPDDGKVRLKIIHTYHVADLAKRIAEDLHLSEEDIQLAQLIGLLHDIGRFEQVRRYHDFRDYLTVDHADLGVEVLQENDLIRSFIEDDQYDELIYKAVSNHNKYAIQSDLDEHTLLHARIIRDADKTDIYRVKIEDPLEDALPFTVSQLENSTVTESVYEEFFKEKSIHTGIRKTPADTLVSSCAMLYDYNFKPGLQYVRDHHYIEKMMHRFSVKDEESVKKLDHVEAYALSYMDRRLSS